MALRLSGQLLLGASRIYWRKARYLLEDCSETLDRIKLNFKIDGQVDMPHDQNRAPISSITLSTNYTSAASNLLLPEPELDLDEILNMVATQQPAVGVKSGAGKENNDINMKEKFNLNKNFGFDSSHNDSILQAFPMSEDFEVETGRRLTDLSGMNMSRDSNPFVGSRDSSAFNLEDNSGIEMGRKELSVVSAFSPMRLSTPGKLNSDHHIDYDMNDNFVWDAETNEQNAAIASPLGAAPFNTPPRPVKKATIARKRKVALDEVIALSSSQIQLQVKDTSDIVLGNQVISGSKRSSTDEVAGFSSEENRRLSSASFAAPNEAVVMLNRPAFDGEFVMDAFGDLFNKNIFSAAAVVEPVVPSTPNKAKTASSTTETYTPMALDMNDDHLYEDMNPEAPMDMEPIFETERRTSSSSAQSDLAQVDVLAVVRGAKKGLTFQAITQDKSRSVAAKAFFDVLALSSKGLIRSEQSATFGQINLSVL